MHRLSHLSFAFQPFSRHSCLLHHQQQLMEKVIETSVMPVILLNLLSIAALLHCFCCNCLPSYSFLPPIVWISIHSIHMYFGVVLTDVWTWTVVSLP